MICTIAETGVILIALFGKSKNAPAAALFDIKLIE